MTARSTALTCCIVPSWWPCTGGRVAARGPSRSTVHGTSTTASSGRPGTAEPLRMFRIIVEASPRLIAAMIASATPS